MKTIFGYIHRYFKKMDKSLFLAAAALSVFGVVLLYSIWINGAASIEVTSGLYKRQAAAVAAGWVIAAVLSAMDYNKFIKLWVLYAPVALILSLLTLTSLGDTVMVDDQRGWLDLGFISIQPSELLKIAFVTTFALHLSKVGDKINRFSNVVLLCIHAGIPLFAVLLQGDDGTACVFALIFVIMMFSAGISLIYILPCLAALPVILYFAWTRVMSYDQQMRFRVLFDSELDPSGIGYHQRVSKMALGSGRIFGKGLFGENYVIVPEAPNDFIFSYVGQCFGFIGCVSVIVVLAYICLKMLADSRIAKDPLGKMLCVGVYAMVSVHSIVNIGMVVGASPVIGVPLPFLSQGGTSALSMYIGIGIVMSVYSHSEKKYRVFYDGD